MHLNLKNRICFPCISGVCPYGKDFLRDCYPKLEEWQKKLFDEMSMLRSRFVKYNK